jgi:hypothetical protein
MAKHMKPADILFAIFNPQGKIYEASSYFGWHQQYQHPQSIG